MDVELFPVVDDAFDGGPQFREWLAENYDPDVVHNDLTMVAALTRKSTSEALESLRERGFSVDRELGAVTKIQASTEVGSVAAYMTLDEPGILIFYTNHRKTEDIPLLESFIQSDPDTYSLFLSPYTIRESLDEFMAAYEDLKVIEFTAKRGPRSRMDAEIRPYEKRTFTYWAEDGLQTLEELQHQYGVLPHRLVIEIPRDTKIRVDKKGFFTYERGDFHPLLDLLKDAVQRGQKTVEAFDGSSFQVLPVETAERQFRIPSSRPVRIRLPNRLSYSEARNLRGKLEQEGYIPLSYEAEEGSLFLRSDLMTEEGERFRIKASQESLRVLPSEDGSFSGFMEFYEFIVDEIDPRAELVK